MGKISNRPANMQKIMINLEKILKFANVQVGPTAARPGPILLKVAKMAVRLVSKPKPSIETNSVPRINMIIYAAR